MMNLEKKNNLLTTHVAQILGLTLLVACHKSQLIVNQNRRVLQKLPNIPLGGFTYEENDPYYDDDFLSFYALPQPKSNYSESDREQSFEFLVDMNPDFNFSTFEFSKFEIEKDEKTGELPEQGYDWRLDFKVNPELSGYFHMFDPYNLLNSSSYDPYKDQNHVAYDPTKTFNNAIPEGPDGQKKSGGAGKRGGTRNEGDIVEQSQNTPRILLRKSTILNEKSRIRLLQIKNRTSFHYNDSDQIIPEPNSQNLKPKSIFESLNNAIEDNSNKYFEYSTPTLEGKILKVKINFSYMDTNFKSIMKVIAKDTKNYPYFLSKDKKYAYAYFPMRGQRITYDLLSENSKSDKASEYSSFIIRVILRSAGLIFHTQCSNLLKIVNLFTIFKFIDMKLPSNINAFMYKFKHRVLAFMPKLYTIKESAVECEPYRKFKVHNYSCSVFNNVNQIIFFFFLMIIFKLIIFLPMILLPKGSIQRRLKYVNRLWGTYTFFQFLSAFTVDLTIPAWIDIKSTIGDDNGQFYGKMFAIFVVSLIGYSSIFFFVKKVSILQNDKAQLSWLYIKFDSRMKGISSGILINELAAFRDLIITTLFVYFHDKPHRQILSMILLVAPLLVFRIVTFPKKNFAENILMIFLEAVVVIIAFLYLAIESLNILEGSSSIPVFVTLFAIFVITAIVGTIVAIIFDVFIFFWMIKEGKESTFRGILSIGGFIKAANDGLKEDKIKRANKNRKFMVSQDIQNFILRNNGRTKIELVDGS